MAWYDDLGFDLFGGDEGGYELNPDDYNFGGDYGLDTGDIFNQDWTDLAYPPESFDFSDYGGDYQDFLGAGQDYGGYTPLPGAPEAEGPAGLTPEQQIAGSNDQQIYPTVEQKVDDEAPGLRGANPRMFKEMVDKVFQWAKTNPFEATMMGIGIIGGVPLLLKGLMGDEGKVSGVDMSQMQPLLDQIKAASASATPVYQQGLSKYSDILSGNYGPGLEDADAVRKRSNELIMKQLGMDSAGEPDPEVAQYLQEQEDQLIKNGMQPGSDAMNRFKHQAALALETSKTGIRGQKLGQYQSLAGPREQEEYARRDTTTRNTLAGIEATNPARSAGVGLASLADIARTNMYGSASNAANKNLRNQRYADAGGALLGFGLSPAYRKQASKYALFGRS